MPCSVIPGQTGPQTCGGPGIGVDGSSQTAHDQTPSAVPGRLPDRLGQEWRGDRSFQQLLLVHDPDLRAVIRHTGSHPNAKQPASASSSSTPVLDIGQLRRPADHAPVSDDDLGRDLLGQALTFALVGTRGRWRAPRALDHVSNGLFAFCSHPGPSGTSEALPGFSERASELVLYLVAGVVSEF